MDLVDEQQVALLEVGEQAGEVARLLDHGAGGHADVAAHLRPENEGERRHQDGTQPEFGAGQRGVDQGRTLVVLHLGEFNDQDAMFAD